MNTQNSQNRNYVLKTSHQGFDVELVTALPKAKRAKSLTLKNGNNTMTLNGRQVNMLKRIFVKENMLNGLKTTIY